jgi:RHS repeat-associated protein
VTDRTGAPVDQDDYGTWGEETRIANQSGNTYRFAGSRSDEHTGLVYMESRYYEPITGHFISADTVIPDVYNPQFLNRYAYVLNDPVTLVDPTGHEPEDEIPPEFADKGIYRDSSGSLGVGLDLTDSRGPSRSLDAAMSRTDRVDVDRSGSVRVSQPQAPPAMFSATNQNVSWSFEQEASGKLLGVEFSVKVDHRGTWKGEAKAPWGSSVEGSWTPPSPWKEFSGPMALGGAISGYYAAPLATGGKMSPKTGGALGAIVGGVGGPPAIWLGQKYGEGAAEHVEMSARRRLAEDGIKHPTREQLNTYYWSAPNTFMGKR